MAELERAIERVTRALATADDDGVTELVAERRQLRAEVEALRVKAAGNVVPFAGRRSA